MRHPITLGIRSFPLDLVEIQRVREQFAAGQWPKFLEMVHIDGLRGFAGQTINFRYPVTAIVGENGTGKSTVLRAAATAYENTAPKGATFYASTFFVNTHWDNVEGVTLRFRVRQGDDTHTFEFRKPTKRWSYGENRIQRPVYFQDISRTLPLDATVGYATLARRAAGEVEADDLAPEYVGKLSNVMSRDYTTGRFARPDIDEAKSVGVLELAFGEMSAFHQGAGEDTTMDLLYLFQTLPRYSLVIIDEVEASLHPRAQRRLTGLLIRLSREKRIQFILSTHSPYVLEELPADARVLLVRGAEGVEVISGASTEFAMSRLDDRLHPELYIFVEDWASAIWLAEIIRADTDHGWDVLRRTQIVPAGDEAVVGTLGRLGDEGKLPYPAIAIADGDVVGRDGVVTLPGDDPPEMVVYHALRDRGWLGLTERFAMGAGDLYQFLDDAVRNPDWHRWNSIVGDQMRKSRESIWEVMASEWAMHCMRDDVRNGLVNAIRDRLN